MGKAVQLRASGEGGQRFLFYFFFFFDSSKLSIE
jgi:hypothetical protein